MKSLRTPDSQFENLPGYPFSPHYTEVDDSEGGTLRIHHVDEGPRDAPIVLCMHGQPSWSYLYRHMIPLLTQAGLRVLAPDLVGYGRSDKPASVEDYSYQRQVDWMTAWLKANDVQNATFFGQDWGGLIGLRIVAENPERFERVVIGNTGLPLPQTTPPEVIEEVRRFRAEAPTPTMPEVMKALGEGGSGPLSFAYWQKWCWESEDLPVGMAVMTACGSKVLTPEEVAAYDAPFPDASFKMGPAPCRARCPPSPMTPPWKPIGKPGKSSRSGTSPSSPHSMTATLSVPAERCNSSRSFRARKAKSTRNSRAAATSFKRPKATNSPKS
ncbi:MAG: haloalkane dehalogenase [Myxococcota bacterium]